MFPNFVRLPDCERVSLVRGGVGPRAGLAGVPPWSDLPLNRIPFSIFAYSSNIFIARLDVMGSMLALGTLYNSRFLLSSS